MQDRINYFSVKEHSLSEPFTVKGTFKQLGEYLNNYKYNHKIESISIYDSTKLFNEYHTRDIKNIEKRIEVNLTKELNSGKRKIELSNSSFEFIVELLGNELHNNEYTDEDYCKEVTDIAKELGIKFED